MPKAVRNAARNIEILRRNRVEGDSLRQIAIGLELNYATVVDIARREKSRIVGLAHAGKPVSDLAEEYGFPAETMALMIEEIQQRKAANDALWRERDRITEQGQHDERLEWGVRYAVEILNALKQNSDLYRTAKENEVTFEAFDTHIELLRPFVNEKP